MDSLSKLLTMLLIATLGYSLAACQTLSVSSTSPAMQVITENREQPNAPWSNDTIALNDTDSVYYQEWLKADTKSLCTILALPKQSTAHLTGHSIRRANFSGGWGVAYDLPDLRSAYGVANTGIFPSGEVHYPWPFNVTYKDNSTIGYGHEGGNPTAPWLAYIRLVDNNCFYNVWSAQGKEHLEQMIKDLRRVNS